MSDIYGGHANVDELRTAYERLQERMHAKCDQIEKLTAALEAAPDPAYRDNPGFGRGPYPEPPGREPADSDYALWFKTWRKEALS